MTEQELEKIEARANAATPGKWTAGEVGVITTDAKISERYDQVASILPICDKSGHCYQDGTTAFIAHARTDVPALVAEVRRLQGLVAENSITATWKEDGGVYRLAGDLFSCTITKRSETKYICSVEINEVCMCHGTESSLDDALAEIERVLREHILRDFDTIIRPEVKS